MQTRDEIIQYAAGAEAYITPPMLRRWAKAGLIPRPDVVWLESSGNTAVYPDGTDRQAVAVYKALRKRRSTDYALWRLWQDGYPVKVKGLFEEALNELRGVITVLTDDTGRLEYSDDYVAWLEEMADSRKIPSWLKRIRKHAGKEDFKQFIDQVMFVYAIPSEMVNNSGDLAYGESVGGFKRGVGALLPNQMTNFPDEWGDDFLQRHLYGVFEEARKYLEPGNVEKVLTSAGNAALREGVEEAIFMFNVLSAGYRFLHLLFKLKADNTIPDTFEDLPLDVQIGWSLAWLSLRQMHGAPDIYAWLRTGYDLILSIGDDGAWRNGPDQDSVIILTDAESRSREKEKFLREMEQWAPKQ